MSLHSIRDLDEPSNVRTSEQAGEDTIRELLTGPLSPRAQADAEALSHDPLELGVDLLGRPRQTLAVLSHLETRNGDTSAVGSL